MKFAIIGSGAVGGYFGARLYEAGHTVYFLARGSHLEAIRKNGVEIKSIAGDYKPQNVESHETVQQIPSVDEVLVAVKAGQVGGLPFKVCFTQLRVYLSCSNGGQNCQYTDTCFDLEGCECSTAPSTF